MADPTNSPAPPGQTAGAMLRAAREQQGLHIATLGAMVKVPVAKLEALESDRYDALPDPAFTRALAQTICRALKIDAQPVLARLPHADPASLDHVAGTLNTPFRERSGGALPRLELRSARPMLWGGALLLLVAAAVVYFLPSSVWQRAPRVEPGAASAPAPDGDAGAPADAASVPDPVPASAVAPIAETVRESTAAAQPASAGPASSLVRLRAGSATWVQVQDAGGRTLLSRMVQAGETVGLDGTLPIRLTIGNASAAELTFRGQPVDLAPLTRNSVARVELK